MKRGHFLKSFGGFSLLPFVPKLHAQSPPGGGSNCILVPSETAGPFPLELLQPAAVHVTVSDLNGKRVWERDFGHLPAGAHTFDLGADLPNGPQSYAVQVVVTTERGRYVAVRRIARM